MGLFYTAGVGVTQDGTYPASGVSRAVIKANREAYGYIFDQLGKCAKDSSGNIKSLATLKAEALALFPTANGFETYDNPPIDLARTTA